MKFYRVCNPETQQGLWYKLNGEFTGLIHDQFSFCTNSELKMDFDPELVGWLSAVKNIDDLWAWFTREDVEQLEKHGWYIHEYEVDNYRFYDKFQHWVICQNTSVVIRKIPLDKITTNF